MAMIRLLSIVTSKYMITLASMTNSKFAEYISVLILNDTDLRKGESSRKFFKLLQLRYNIFRLSILITIKNLKYNFIIEKVYNEVGSII